MAKKNENGLTDKQQACADLYLADPDRIKFRAYRMAYPSCKSDKTAASNFTKLLKNTEFSNYIEKRMAEIGKELDITQESLIKDLETIKERCMQVEPVLNNKGEETGDYVFKGNEAINAIKLMGQHLYGMWITKKVQGDPDKPIVHTHVVSDELDFTKIRKRRDQVEARKVH